MAKVRMVNTRFWVDDYISNLDPIEKLLFLYFLTNPYTEICGVYEVPLKTIATDTGLDKEMVIKILGRFKKDKKVIYKNGWVAIVNFAKHQLKNPSVAEGIKRGLELAPKEIKDILYTDCIQTDPSLSYLNLDLNLNSNLERDEINSAHLSYLEKIPQDDIDTFLLRFEITKSQLVAKAESMKLYCQSKGKKYKDYKALLLNALKKDFQERKQKKPVEELPEGRPIPKEIKESIKAITSKFQV